jgi:hypothetical protein
MEISIIAGHLAILFRLIQIRTIDNPDVVFWRECADNRPGKRDVEEGSASAYS